MEEDTLKRQGCGRDSLICMCSGLKEVRETSRSAGLMALLFGRVLAVAEHVFPVSCSSASLPKHRHQRETQALGRAPQRSPTVEPTQRRASTSVPGAAAPRVVPPRVPVVTAMVMLRRFSRCFVVLGSRKNCWCRWRQACSLRRRRRFLRGDRQMAHLKEQLRVFGNILNSFS